MGLTTTLSNSAVNDVRLVYMRYVNQTAVPMGSRCDARIARFQHSLDSTGGMGQSFRRSRAYPRWGSTTTVLVLRQRSQSIQQPVQAIDNFTKIVGTHSMQFGGTSTTTR